MFTSGQRRECLFLTEDGMYEVLMKSRKPIVKYTRRFKKC
nr:MAG TPA: BRO family protein [Caudoviricetes sp.]